MILEEETFKAYGYYPRDLGSKSNKLVLASCDKCGAVRKYSKIVDRPLCNWCIWKKKHPEGMPKGDKHPAWTGGKKKAQYKSNVKRRKLGNTFLMPLKNGEEGHHVTDEYVIGIPAEVHNIIGGTRKEHRTHVLQWLKANDKKKYKTVLCILAKHGI